MSVKQALFLFVIVHIFAIGLELLTGGTVDDATNTIAGVALWCALRGAREDWVRS